MKKCKLMICSDYYRPGYKGGGPIKSVENLVESLGENFSITILTSNRDLGSKRQFEESEMQITKDLTKSKIYYLKNNFLFIKEIIRQDWDVIYFNSFFSFRTVLALFCMRLCIIKLSQKAKIIIAPRGELSLETLKLKTVKKRMYIMVFRILMPKFVFHSTSNEEKVFIDHCLKVESIMIPNLLGKNILQKVKYVQQARKLTFVFLSRISIKKNLSLIIRAINKIEHQIELDIYGPIEDIKYYEDCLELIENSTHKNCVRYCGSVPPPKVSSLLKQYKFFVG